MQQSVSWQTVLGRRRHSRLRDRALERIRAVCSVPFTSDWGRDLAGWYRVYRLAVCPLQLLTGGRAHASAEGQARHWHRCASPSEPQLALGDA